MFQQALWLGLSLAVHLVLVACLIFPTARNVEQTPKSVMVVLDDFETAETPVLKNSQARSMKAVLPISPVSARESAKHDILKASALHALPLHTAREGIQVTEASLITPEVRGDTADLPRSEDAIPAATVFTEKPLQHPITTSDKQTKAVITEQHYLKEHFASIRDLIAQRLVYPVMARKMGWSGKVVVAFTVYEDGNVHAVRILETSGYSILDKSALETVKNVAPFPRPPVRSVVIMPINFKIMTY